MSNEVIIYFLLAFVVANFGAAIFISLGRMSLRKIIGLNNSEVARHYLLLLVGQAKRKIVIYDDGHADKGSYYSEKEVLHAIETRLRAHPDLLMQCVFNYPVPKPLSTKFAGDHRVDLRTTGLGDHAPPDVRMTVIDDGRMVYSTQYNPTLKVWQFELVDCSSIMRWALKRAVKTEFGERIGLVEQKFSQASET